MKILVIGAGAIGSLVGGKLALAGEEITLVGRPAFAAAVTEHGLRLRQGDDEQSIRTITAAGSMAEAFASGTSYDLAILTVKSYDTATALNELVAAAPSPPAVLSLQNGVGNEETIASMLGAERVIAGTLTTPVSVPAPATIRIDRPSFTMGISAWGSSASSPAPLVDSTHAALLRAGFKAKRYANAQGMKWTKLLMNMMGNATSAILDQPPAQLFTDTRVVDIEIAAWREALAVMSAAHVPPVNLGSYPFAWFAPLIRTAPNALLRSILRRQVSGARGDKMPSLHIDLHAGKQKSEINWLNGAIVERGNQVGVATPVNKKLTKIVTSLLGNPEAQAAWQGNTEELVTQVAAAR